MESDTPTLKRVKRRTFTLIDNRNRQGWITRRFQCFPLAPLPESPVIAYQTSCIPENGEKECKDNLQTTLLALFVGCAVIPATHAYSVNVVVQSARHPTNHAGAGRHSGRDGRDGPYADSHRHSHQPEFREAGLCHRTGWAGHPSADDIQ